MPFSRSKSAVLLPVVVALLLILACISFLLLDRFFPSLVSNFATDKPKTPKLVNESGVEIENSIDFIGNNVVRITGSLLNNGYSELDGKKYITITLPEIGKTVRAFFALNQEKTYVLLLDNPQFPMNQAWKVQRLDYIEQFLIKNRYIRTDIVLSEVDYSKYQNNLPNELDLYQVSNIALLK